MIKTYLVTGGAGFIGSHLCDKLLKQGYRVINIDNFCDFYVPKIKAANIEKVLNHPNYILEKADIRDKPVLNRIFKNNPIAGVIHLAAMAGVRPSILNPNLYNEVNITGTLNLLECCKTYAVKNFIFGSSSSVYGNNKRIPFKESDQVDEPISPYAATKKAAELIGHVYHHLWNINIICLRFFTVYGERQRPDLAIHKFTKLIDSGKPIPFFGAGDTERDYTYIADIIDGITKAMYYIETHNRVYEIFNLGENETIKLKTMVELIERELGKKARIDQLPLQAGDMVKTYADITKAKKMLGYNPQTGFEIGIRRFVDWYKIKTTVTIN